jgi:hypothetical protein
MTVFSQIELLPIAYFIVLMSVICANVLAKFLGERLVCMTSGPLRRLLTLQVDIPVTGDTINLHLFERQLIQHINTQLLFQLNINFTRWMSGEKLKITPTEPQSFPIQLYPQIYWSGCPPNAA